MIGRWQVLVEALEMSAEKVEVDEWKSQPFSVSAFTFYHQVWDKYGGRLEKM
jgi:hypothetical protein